MNKIIIGIDPGLDGALVVRRGNEILIHDTPTLTVSTGKKNKRQCDAYGMAHILRAYTGEDVHVALEKVHSMPGQLNG